MSTWEERMSQRAHARASKETQAAHRDRLGEFTRYVHPDDPDEILLEIIAARCLGITHGDPGPKLPPEDCRQCWGDRLVWVGNTWGLNHRGIPRDQCRHTCHDNEILLAAHVLTLDTR